LFVPVVATEAFIVHSAESCAKRRHAFPTDVARSLDGTGGFASGQGGTVVCTTGQRMSALTGDGADASEDGTGRGTPIIAFAQNQRDEVRDLGDRAGALAAEPGMKQQTYVMAVQEDNQNGVCERPTVGTLRPDAPGTQPGGSLLRVAGTVRRLTPRECERLMGWPDDWTRYREDGSEIADGPRYRMCGNGVVGTVAHWLGRRLLAAEGVT
jgi:DNA (cytosine-5)-methyltransferase 1